MQSSPPSPSSFTHPNFFDSYLAPETDSSLIPDPTHEGSASGSLGYDSRSLADPSQPFAPSFIDSDKWSESVKAAAGVIGESGVPAWNVGTAWSSHDKPSSIGEAMRADGRSPPEVDAAYTAMARELFHELTWICEQEGRIRGVPVREPDDHIRAGWFRAAREKLPRHSSDASGASRGPDFRTVQKWINGKSPMQKPIFKRVIDENLGLQLAIRDARRNQPETRSLVECSNLSELSRLLKIHELWGQARAAFSIDERAIFFLLVEPAERSPLRPLDGFNVLA
jgi:hypothetical protein